MRLCGLRIFVKKFSGLWCVYRLRRADRGSGCDPDSLPLPSEFLGLLLTGRYSLVEAHYLTTRYINWRMVLWGDPLYNPSRGNRTF